MNDLPHDSSLGGLFQSAQEGNETAINKLAEYLFPRALELARRELFSSPTPMVDHEDLACSAIRSLCIRVREQKIGFAGDQPLSALLKKIIYAKAAGYWRRELTQKRDRNRLIQDESDECSPIDFLAASTPDSIILTEGSISLLPDEEPAFNSVIRKLQLDIRGLFGELFRQLEGNSRKMLLLMVTSSFSNEEMARELGCAVASVERYRASIKRKISRIIEGNQSQ